MFKGMVSGLRQVASVINVSYRPILPSSLLPSRYDVLVWTKTLSTTCKKNLPSGGSSTQHNTKLENQSQAYCSASGLVFDGVTRYQRYV